MSEGIDDGLLRSILHRLGLIDLTIDGAPIVLEWHEKQARGQDYIVVQMAIPVRPLDMAAVFDRR